MESGPGRDGVGGLRRAGACASGAELSRQAGGVVVRDRVCIVHWRIHSGGIFEMKSLIPHSPPHMRLLVVGMNHRTAPLSVREDLAFSPEQLQRAMAAIRERFAGAEAVIVSTCNRVEIYAARAVGAEPTVESLTSFLAEF